MRSYITFTLREIRIIRIIESRRMRRAGDVTPMREKRNAYRILVGKPEGKETARKI
jgi:hypothetical protein